MNEIDEALEFCLAIKRESKKHDVDDIIAIEIMNKHFKGEAWFCKNLDSFIKALTAAKEREAVDVNIECKRCRNGDNLKDWFSCLRCGRIGGHKQGHLTSSEKPTRSIPEGYALVPVEPTEKMLIDAGAMQGYDTDDMDSSAEEHHIAWWKIMCEAAKGEGE